VYESKRTKREKQTTVKGRKNEIPTKGGKELNVIWTTKRERICEDGGGGESTEERNEGRWRGQ